MPFSLCLLCCFTLCFFNTLFVHTTPSLQLSIQFSVIQLGIFFLTCEDVQIFRYKYKTILFLSSTCSYNLILSFLSPALRGGQWLLFFIFFSSPP